MRTSLALAATAFALTGSACYVELNDPYDADRGDLTLRYRFDGLRCDDAGVHRISVRLDGERYGETYRDDVSCAGFAWGITLEDLQQDTYRVQIEGRDAMGTVLYRVQGARVEVRWATHQEYDVEVPSAGGSLTLYWTFDGSGACGAVQDVRVTLEDPDGFVYDDARYLCEYGGVAYDGLIQGLWRLTLDGLDGMDRLVATAGPQNVVVIGAADNIYTLDLGSVR